MDGVSNLALRYETERYENAAPLGEPWLPPENPLDVSRQSLGRDAPVLAAAPATSPIGIGKRRAILFGASLLLTCVIALTP